MVEVAGGGEATRLMDTVARRESSVAGAGGFGSTRLGNSARIPPRGVQRVASLGATTKVPSEHKATAFVGGALLSTAETRIRESGGALSRFNCITTADIGATCTVERTERAGAGGGAVGGGAMTFAAGTFAAGGGAFCAPTVHSALAISIAKIAV